MTGTGSLGIPYRGDGGFLFRDAHRVVMRSSGRIARSAVALAAVVVFASSCGSDAAPAATTADTTGSADVAAADSSVATDTADAATAADDATAIGDAATGATAEDGADEADIGNDGAVGDDEAGAASTFVAEVWADNWFSLSVNGELVGEDSVPITTERSFNAETITFDATYPLTIGIEAKDFKETDSGLEYIGEGNQQMGDGGIIVQITDTSTGEVVAGSDGTWSALVVHRAPLNVECENSTDPDSECEFEITETPAGWTDAAFDVSAWPTATEWSEAAVSPKDGYGQIDWDPAAQLIWGTDLEVDNTVLLRTTIGA